MRTGAAGAISVKHFVAPHHKKVGYIGAGVIGKAMARASNIIHKFEEGYAYFVNTGYEHYARNDDDNTRADLSTESEIQQPKQSGYCYIGTDRTFRSCVKMNAGDTCVSKKVFPTKDICINPSLRK